MEGSGSVDNYEEIISLLEMWQSGAVTVLNIFAGTTH
jgi:hypothetical protein